MPMTLCLRHTPNAIAAAAVVLGSRYCKETVPPQADGKPGKVWDKHVAESEIKEIINEILDFFDAMVGSQSAAAEPMPDSVAASPSSDASPVYGSAPASPLVVLSGPSAEPSRPARPQDASSSCGAPSSDAACPPPPPPPRDEPLEEGELELTASGSIVAPAAAASSDTVAAVAAVGAVAASVADAVPDASAPVADACAAASDAGSSASVAVGSPVVASGRLDSPVPDRRPLAAAESQTVVASVAVVPEAISVL